MQHDIFSSLCEKKFTRRFPAPIQTFMHFSMTQCSIILDSVFIDWHKNCMILCEREESGKGWFMRILQRVHAQIKCFEFFNLHHDSFEWMKVSHLFIQLPQREQIEWPYSCLMERFVSSSLILPQPSISFSLLYIL